MEGVDNYQCFGSESIRILKLIGNGEAEALGAAAVERDGEGMERADLEF